MEIPPRRCDTGPVRIVGGTFRGRKLLARPGLDTRPITSRVKTALFDALGGRIDGAVVVDLFAGTGSIGLEAISRGARRCAFAERDRQALQRLRRNIEAMGLSERCEVWCGDILAGLGRHLRGLGEPVDLAFVDPPYPLTRRWASDGVPEGLFEPLGRHLAPEGRAMLRCERNLSLPEAFGPLCVRHRREYGKMALLFLAARQSPESP